LETLDAVEENTPETLELSARAARPTPRARLPLGTLINGRYRVDAVLGEGGMGAVYRVEDALNPERRVALKAMHGSLLGPARVSLLRSEFKTMAGLRHPNVERVYDFESLEGTADYFFTMEYIAGRDLYSATEGVPCERIVELVVQVCRALSYLHSRRIVHSDLKPGNLLVDEDGQVRVLDFGIASGGTLMGTPPYMAPEMFLTDAAIDHRADLYGLGIVAYQLLCRRLPFVADSISIVRRMHASEPLVFDEASRERTPEWLRRAVEHLAAKDPAERPRSANAVIEELNRGGGTTHQLETATTRESYILSSRFVGREAERERLLDFVWERTGATTSDGPAALMVSGVSGVGKSRLVREVKQQAQLAGLTFIESNCYENVFTELAGIGDALKHLGLIDPALAESTEAPPVSDEHRESELRARLDRLSERFVALTERTPYVLYVNDLQWAPPETIDLLFNVIRRVSLREKTGQRTRLAILGSYRADEVEGRPLSKLLGQLEPLDELAVVRLAPLDPPQVRRLVGSMLGIEAPPEAFVDRVASETAGNPFFVEEVMRSLVDRGAVYLEHGAWAASAAIGELEIPATIASVFRHRAALLDDKARAILELMAVYAQPIRADLLAECSRLSEEETQRALRELVDRQMVTRQRGLLHAISHDRMRETLYADLAGERRPRLHAAIAEVLEARIGAEPSWIHELARHLWHAQDRERALRYGLLAGRRAEQAYANDLAREHFEHVWALLGDDDRSGSIGQEVTEKLADLECLTSHWEAALPRYRALLEAEADRLARARLLRKLGQLQAQKGELRASLEPLWEAVELLGGKKPTGPISELWYLLRAVATHLLHRAVGPLRPARDDGERARLLELCSAELALSHSYFFLEPRRFLSPILSACSSGERAAGDSKELSRVYKDIAFTYAYLGMNRPAAQFGDRALAIAERLEASLEIGTASVFRGMVNSMNGEYDRAEELCVRGRALLLKHGDLYFLTICETNLCNVRFFGGRTRAAAESAEEITQLVERTGSQSYGKQVIASAGYFRGMLGDRAVAAARLEQALQMARATTDPVSELSVLALRGHLEYERGELPAALETLEAGRRILNATDSNFYLAALLLPALALARIAASPKPSRSERREIQRTHDAALAHTRRRPQFRAYSLLAQAVWSWHKGDRARGRKQLEAMIAFAETQGNAWASAEGRLELGRMLAAEGERDAARGLLAVVEADFARFEMAPLLARTRSALAAL
jgi:hypothetical protein